MSYIEIDTNAVVRKFVRTRFLTYTILKVEKLVAMLPIT
jgi:hypothetical protein